MPAAHHRRWTAREVGDLIARNPLNSRRYELVDGELLVTPSPAPLHQAAVGALFVRLRAFVYAQGIGQVLMSPSDVETETSFLSQPDIYVMPREEWQRVGRPGHTPVHSLLLAVEVVSPSSNRHDRVTKRRHYQRTVPEYWIVDLDAELVERWRNDDVRPEINTNQLTWAPEGAGETLDIDLVEFFHEVIRER